MRRMLMTVVVVMALATGVIGAMAAERPPATLVRPNVSSYTELNLERLQGKTADLAALRDVLTKMQMLKVAEKAFSQDPQAKAVFDEVLGYVTGMNDAIGPRIGFAVWAPDLAEVMGAAFGGTQMGEGAPPGMPMFVLVAELKDRAKFEETWKRLAERAQIPVAEEQEERGVTRTLFEGDGGLVRGDDWLAIGYPWAPIKEAQELAAGRMSPSLASDPVYQKVIAGLPKDALLTEYIGPQVLRQLSAAAALLLPSVQFSLPTRDGLGIAVGMRVEDQGGRQMLTVYKTADLDSLSYLLDVPLSIAAMAAYPALTRSQESARKAQCLANMKNTAMAVQMYLADNDKFPEADKWVDQLADYIANEEILKCPDDESDARCSYGFNASLSGKSAAEIADPSQLVVIYETASPGDCPSGGPDDVASPARHMGGNNFGYADGHAQWHREGEPLVFEESAEEEQKAPQH